LLKRWKWKEQRFDGMGAQVIGRRGVLLAGACVVARQAAAALPIPPDNALAFRLIRHGSEIGRHTLAFDRQGETLTVHIAVDAKITLLTIPVAHYTHRSVETWQGDTLVGLTGQTNKNGEQGWMNARRTSEGLVVLGSKAARYVAPPQAIGVSYWNKRMLNGPMISLENGELLRPKVAADKTEAVPLATGGTIPADRYNISGPFNVDVWYDRTGTWASLALDISDGSEVHYERL
jgi:hypothetical protein